MAFDLWRKRQSFLGRVTIAKHFLAERLVGFLGVELQRDDHALLTVLALVLLANHEPHVGIDSDAVAVDANPKRHSAHPRDSLLFREGCAKFAKVNSVVLVDIKSNDDH